MNKIIAALMVGLFAVSVNSFADVGTKGDFAKNHPRRAQVNHRLNNQNKRIHNEVKEGEMSKTQAAGLHKQDHQIRQNQVTKWTKTDTVTVIVTVKNNNKQKERI